MITLKAQPREDSVDLKSLREEGILPAVFYGPKEETVSIAVSAKEFEKTWKEAGESTVVTLETPKGKKSVLINDVQFDPVKSTPIHIDFYVVEADKEVEVNVPLEFVDVAPAVKELSGTLVKVLHELHVKGLPADLPHGIEVNISSLEALDSQILAKDIALPKGISLVVNPDDVVASVATAKEEEPEVEEGAGIDSIEVEKKGKKEEEEGAEE